MILVDDREPESIKQHFSWGGEVTRLSFGDFAFSGNGPDGDALIGIERKKINDLLNSITSGRLSGRQLPGLMSTYDIGFLLVEGAYRADRSGFLEIKTSSRNWWTSGLKMGAVVGYLTTVSCICGVHVIRSTDEAETVQYVRFLEKWFEKPWSSHSSHKAVSFLKMPSESPWDPQMNMVSKVAYQIPGLGLKRAKAAGLFFGSVQEMCDADVKAWMEVGGIGKKLATMAREALR